MAPDLVLKALPDGGPRLRVLDPMAGSGTTLVTQLDESDLFRRTNSERMLLFPDPHLADMPPIPPYLVPVYELSISIRTLFPQSFRS